MSTGLIEERVDKTNTEDVEVRIPPEETLVGGIEKPILVKKGTPIPGNNGNKGGGQK
jgi:hypothetical protein